MSELLVMGRSIETLRQFSPLITREDWELWFSYGEQIPELQHDHLFFGAGRFAAALKRLQPERRFSSPGASWLPNLPKEFLGRKIYEESFEEALEVMPTSLWFKFAELKHDLVPARVYKRSELLSIAEELPELKAVRCQWTEDKLTLNFEHRFFVVDGELLTGSPYHVDGKVTFAPGEPWRRFEEAEYFAAIAAKELKENAPTAYTLDVAFDVLRERWLIVEGNRAWSSGFYGADVLLALEAVKVSLAGDDDWDWVADEVVSSYVESLTVAKNPEQASGLIRVTG
jgi:hypothetical protein